MILTASSRPEDFCAAWASVDGDRYFVAWKGAVYERGFRLGRPTVDRLIARLSSQPLSTLRRSLHGVFALFVFNKQASEWSVLVDNAGLYKIYFDGDSVSTSLLDLVRARSIGIESLSPTAVADFMASRGVHWNETLITGIRTVGREETLQMSPPPGSPLKVARDVYAPAGGLQPVDFVEYMGDLATAIEGVATSVDLSGGFDSRLVACLLDERSAEFETAVSGYPGLPDIRISRQAADVIGHPSFVTEHDLSSIVDDLETLFFSRDGNGDVLEYHRMGQLQAHRKSRGIQLGVSGVGGEIFKDFWWLQDFPRYRSRRTNFARLYDMRLAGVPIPAHLLDGDVAKAQAQRRTSTLRRFEMFRSATNTESYDRVFCFYQMPVEAGNILTAHANAYFPVLAPFLDHDNFLIGNALPRRKRVFNTFHRELLATHCPGLAALKTDIGVTARSGGLSSARDAAIYSWLLTKRFVDKVGQRTRGKAFFWTAANAPDLVARAKSCETFTRSVDAMKDAGLLQRGVTSIGIPDAFVGRVLTLGMMVRYLRGDLRFPGADHP